MRLSIELNHLYHQLIRFYFFSWVSPVLFQLPTRLATCASKAQTTLLINWLVFRGTLVHFLVSDPPHLVTMVFVSLFLSCLWTAQEVGEGVRLLIRVDTLMRSWSI